MGRRKPKAKSEFVLFNVEYQDGTRTSNRRVPGDIAEGPDGEDGVRAEIEAQDREIAARSGVPRGPIKAIKRA